MGRKLNVWISTGPFCERKRVMKNIKHVTILAGILCLALTDSSSAGRKKSRNCCQDPCTPVVSSNCGNTQVQWYKAKDGSYREMLPYWTALGRAEDADDLEIKLQETNAELDAVKAEAEAEKAKLLALLDQHKATIAQAQTEISSQRERAEKAETAHKSSIELIADVRDAQKRTDEQLESARSELKAANDKLAESAKQNENLQLQVLDLQKQNDASQTELKAAQDELNRPKQDAAKSEKPEVTKEGE
jgi:DNA repair exonuclease SbcCD ATPase subunit